MGKKSKKGVPRATTKKHQHHAAGQGKSSNKALATGHQHNNTSSCDNSIDSSNVVRNMKYPSGTVGVAPTSSVNVKQQIPQQPQQQHHPPDDASIKLMKLLNEMINKENSNIPSVTVISGKQPTAVLFNVETGTVDDVIDATDMIQHSEDDPSNVIDTKIDATLIIEEKAPTILESESEAMTSTATTEMIRPTQETLCTDLAINPDVTTEPELEQQQAPVPKKSPTEVTADDTNSSPFLKNDVSEKEEAMPIVESPEPLDTKPSNDPHQIWSNTLRSIVSIDDDDGDEVLADTSFSNHKAVMDVTPLKHSKVVVPIIQTVSPSPDHRYAQPNNLSKMTNDGQIPSLDTPDKKDVDRDDMKQNLCGCSIM